MANTTTILIGAPLEGNEAAYLGRLCNVVAGRQALILANFHLTRGSDSRQVDFVVVTDDYAALVELKNLDGPIEGGVNGPWKLTDRSGRAFYTKAENPYQQALAVKFALSDVMKRYAQDAGEPGPLDQHFFREFDAFVSIDPHIGPGSSLFRGDFKVKVASSADVEAAIANRSLPRAWDLAAWKRFAVSRLGLHESALRDATDAAYRAAVEVVGTYTSAVRASLAGLPPLLPNTEGTPFGEPLLLELAGADNVAIVGPSGSAKSFHLAHLAREVAAGGRELPVLIEAGRYRGGEMGPLLEGGTGRFFAGEAEDLLRAARAAGRTPLLVVDAFNECRRDLRGELAREIEAVAKRFGARVVVASQESPRELEAIAAREIPLPAFAPDQKRRIYAYHARVEPSPALDRFCEAFPNAFDLKVAGECHGRLTGEPTVTALYDAYCRSRLGDRHEVLLGLLRAAARRMAEDAAVVLSRDDFEMLGESFLAGQYPDREDPPLGLLEELRESRLVRLDEYFMFEHERLLAYMRAEVLRRRHPQAPELAAALRLPRHRDLVGLLLPRYGGADLDALLETAEVGALRETIEGRNGRRAGDALVARCERLLADAVEDLPRLALRADPVRDADGSLRHIDIEISGEREWSEYEARLFTAVGASLDSPRLRAAALDVVDLTSRRIGVLVREAASAARVSPRAVWTFLEDRYHGSAGHPSVTRAVAGIAGGLYSAITRFGGGPSAARGELIERALGSERSRLSLHLLAEELRYNSAPDDVELCMRAAEACWALGTYHFGLKAFDVLQFLALWLKRERPELRARVVAMVEGFDASHNVMLNSAKLDALISLEAVESGVSADHAGRVARLLVSKGALRHPDVVAMAELGGQTPLEVLTEWAHCFVNDMWGELSGAEYSGAFEALSERDQGRLLRRAARVTGASTTLVLRWLLRRRDRRARRYFERAAGGVDATNPIVHESVDEYLLGVLGCARLGVPLPAYSRGTSAEHAAWELLGRLLYWAAKDADPAERDAAIAEAWSRFNGPVALALPDALQSFYHAIADLEAAAGVDPSRLNLVAAWGAEVRALFLYCLKNRGELTALRGWDRDLAGFVVRVLAEVGDSDVVEALRDVVDDPKIGADAIAAIRKIQLAASGARGG